MKEVRAFMRLARPKSVLERDAREDLWRHTLSQIPTLFGKLQYLASLRDPNSGRYEHHGLALVFGEKEAEKALKQNHRRLFGEWLGAGLEQQHDDLWTYLHSLGTEISQVVESWDLLEPWKGYLPAGVNSGEKALYVSDIRTLLRMFKGRFSAASPDLTA